MSKHTPGPWTVDPVKTRLGGPRVDYKGENVHLGIADLWEVDEAGEGAEANARLIAVAPELLAALKLACEYMPLIRSCDLKGEEALACKDFEAMRAAIAKAEGSA